MLKRIALTLTFLAAFATVGLTFTDSAQAWRGRYGGYGYGYGRPYSSYYAGPAAYYGYATPYYGPRAAYYGAPAPYVVGPPVYRSYYRGGAPYYYGGGSGVSVSFGY